MSTRDADRYSYPATAGQWDRRSVFLHPSNLSVRALATNLALKTNEHEILLLEIVRAEGREMKRARSCGWRLCARRAER